jgi:hypothetical protein
MDHGDHNNGDAPPTKTMAVIDLDAPCKTMDAGQGAIESASGLQAISEQIKAAQDAIRAHGGVESLAAQSQRASRAIEQATAGLKLPLLMNDSAGLSMFSATSRIF